jgi:LysM repeat protein
VATGWCALVVGLAACDGGSAPVAAPQVVQGEPQLPPLALAGGAAPGAGGVIEAPPPLPPPPDPLPPPEPEEHRITVRSGETLGLFERWSGVPVADLLEANRLKKARGLRVGQPFVIVMTPEQAVGFSRTRREFHRSREEAFFRTRAIVKLMPYVVQSGDTLRAISTRYSDVPRWLMEKVNRGHDLTHLRAGDIINLPVVREAPPAAARELEARAAAAAAALDGGGDADAFALPPPERAVQVLSTPLAGGSGGPADEPGVAWDDGSGAASAAGAEAATEAGAPVPRSGVTWFSDDEGDGPPPPVVVNVDIKVRKGERLVHYAQWSGTSIDRIARANDLLDPGRLKLGQALQVPVEEARVTDFYEQRRVFHNGPDPTPQRGAAVRALARPAAAEEGLTRTFGYTVRPGETAWEIGVKRFGLTMRQLEEHNPAINLNRLRTGDVLQIPVSVIR